jgi:hypothetical protein
LPNTAKNQLASPILAGGQYYALPFWQKKMFLSGWNEMCISPILPQGQNRIFAYFFGKRIGEK